MAETPNSQAASNGPLGPNNGPMPAAAAAAPTAAPAAAPAPVPAPLTFPICFYPTHSEDALANLTRLSELSPNDPRITSPHIGFHHRGIRATVHLFSDPNGRNRAQTLSVLPGDGFPASDKGGNMENEYLESYRDNLQRYLTALQTISANNGILTPAQLAEFGRAVYAFGSKRVYLGHGYYVETNRERSWNGWWSFEEAFIAHQEQKRDAKEHLANIAAGRQTPCVNPHCTLHK